MNHHAPRVTLFSTKEILEELHRRATGNVSVLRLSTATLTRELLRRDTKHRDACRRGGKTTGASKARSSDQARANVEKRWSNDAHTPPDHDPHTVAGEPRAFVRGYRLVE